MLLVMALLFTGIYIKQPSTSYASDSSNITKMLSAYKKHNYSTAEKYAKKIRKAQKLYAYESAVNELFADQELILYDERRFQIK